MYSSMYVILVVDSIGLIEYSECNILRALLGSLECVDTKNTSFSFIATYDGKLPLSTISCHESYRYPPSLSPLIASFKPLVVTNNKQLPFSFSAP